MDCYNKNTKAGFTLVELIVVIAILGILAGIAIPVYSGYIKKANQAADNVLLGAVNTAFAAACVENNTTNVAQTGVSLQSGTAITSVSGTSDDSKIPASFEKYFAGNSGELKYYKNDGDIVFMNGLFMDITSAANAAVSANPALSALSSEQLQAAIKTAQQVQNALNGSSYADSEAALLGDVQALTNAVKLVSDTVPASVLTNLLGGSFGSYLTEKGVDNSDTQAIANYASLFLAQQVAGLTDDQKNKIADIWSSNTFVYGTTPGDIIAGVQQYADPETGLSTMGAMALFYANAEAAVQNMSKNYNPTDAAGIAQKQAVIDAFSGVASSMSSTTSIDQMWSALSTGYTGMITGAGDNTELITALTTYGSGNGADAESFINAMTAINSNASDLESMTDNAALYSMFSSLFGN